MKKIHTLIALILVSFMGAKAELVQDYEIDYSNFSGFPFYVMGYVPEWNDGVMTDLGAMYTYVTAGGAQEANDIIVTTQDGVKYKRVTLDMPQWHQYFIADRIPTEPEGPYIVKAMVKASEPCTINVNMGWGWGEGQQISASVSIGTEWKEVEWEYYGIGGYSCNLVAQPGQTTATIEWKYLTVSHINLDKGYFVAGRNPDTGLEYDFDNAIPFVYDEAEQYYTATIGEKGAYVSQVMVSTVRGDDRAFMDNTLKPLGNIENNPEVWVEYEESSIAKLSLPGEGIWKIYIDDEYKYMAFEMTEGNIIDYPEINPNPTLVVVDALERDYTQGEMEGGHGQPWDNQFWIVANRTLSAGERTILKFKYKSSIPAEVSTQCHSTPGYYLYWSAIGEVNFTEEWQDFETTFTVPSEADGMQSIAFNLSVIKEANRYELKDFVWKLDDDTESLIDQEGSQNFYFKLLGGNIEEVTKPYAPGDVNHDGSVNVTDVMITVGEILGNQVNNYYPEQADVNNDGTVNITDVMLIVDIILHSPSDIPTDVETPLDDLGGFAGGGDPASAD